jgi:MFS family permease
VCALALVALAVIAETIHEPDGIIRVRAGLGVPLGMRAVMAGACLGIFAAFSILGTFSSLVPTFLHGILAVRNLALIGAASFLIFIIAAITQAVSARLPARRIVTAGLPLLLLCLAALEAALFAKALWLFLAGTVIGGIAVGLIFRGSLSELNQLAGARDRAGVVSTFFAAAYLGLGIPAVLTGLISQLISTVDASVYTSGLVAAIVLAAIVVVLRTFGIAPAPKPVAARPTQLTG